jgi:nucleoside-diphosphate-sugar epimerase
MRILVTGHQGYIGSLLVPRLMAEGHHVVGLDSGWFSHTSLGPVAPATEEICVDIRDVQADDLRGFDAIIHLAGISNDPLGDLNPDCTFEINHLASVRLARLAREVGVPRFLFASSCSLYGAASPDEILDESAGFNPVTPYGQSKILVEQDLDALADDRFSPVYLRCATAYGYSPRLRADLVVNNLVGYALTTGEILMKSDGTPWRPLVHVDDICSAYMALLKAPRQLVHNTAFNVGRSTENYQVREVAEMVKEVIPEARIEYAAGASGDSRCYRVSCQKLESTIADYQPRWTVRAGIQELAERYRQYGFSSDDLGGPAYQRIRRIQQLQGETQIDDSLRSLVAQ